MGSEGSRTGFTGADADSELEGQNEYFSVANLAGLSGYLDSFDGPVSKGAFNGNLDFDLRYEAHSIFSTPVEFRMTALAAMAFDFGDSDALDAESPQCLAHLLQFEWFDNGNNVFHAVPLR
jgi:hypothetical protein